jgi:hypothetical protein
MEPAEWRRIFRLGGLINGLGEWEFLAKLLRPPWSQKQRWKAHVVPGTGEQRFPQSARMRKLENQADLVTIPSGFGDQSIRPGERRASRMACLRWSRVDESGKPIPVKRGSA